MSPELHLFRTLGGFLGLAHHLWFGLPGTYLTLLLEYRAANRLRAEAVRLKRRTLVTGTRR